MSTSIPHPTTGRPPPASSPSCRKIKSKPPNLRRYAQFVLGSPEFKGNLTLVGPVFQPVDYGMLVSRPNGTVHPLYHVFSLATYDWFKSRSLVPGTNKSYRDSALENVDRWEIRPKFLLVCRPLGVCKHKLAGCMPVF
jgi:hypothetical protein